MLIGELFILGFFGKTVPVWLQQFAARYGLGGVILFDYSCQTQQYDNNIESPEQVPRLCREIAALPSGPMVFIDQEGGLVRRLKEASGFTPLPSARNSTSAPEQKRAILPRASPRCGGSASTTISRRHRRRLQPQNPNIGKIKRSFSADIGEVEANALLASEVARAQRIGLCLKHFPGIGGAVVDASGIHGHFRFASRANRNSCSIRSRQNVRRCGAGQPCHRQAMGPGSPDHAVPVGAGRLRSAFRIRC